ncbi:hypothetical protein I4F81_002768 [Pyropia yezoensis]|uniref:Uncharacterized protein n=1 Tax=Pyropia yezoensis TaxID=2788 RepID=A0ACC3BQB1_PYRYE|nr:hypothetical protein I4F81_002768 [Neopyropia yezoensis]
MTLPEDFSAAAAAAAAAARSAAATAAAAAGVATDAAARTAAAARRSAVAAAPPTVTAAHMDGAAAAVAVVGAAVAVGVVAARGVVRVPTAEALKGRLPPLPPASAAAARAARRSSSASAAGATGGRHRPLVLRGVIVKVTDGDGVRLYHQPLLRRLLPLPRDAAKANRSISIRLAGVDAPECAHWGNPAQPGGLAARRWLTARATGVRAAVTAHGLDQYGRLVGTVAVPRRWAGGRLPGVGWENLSVALAEAGHAQVYYGGGAVYGGALGAMEAAVKTAVRRRRGMWAAGPGRAVVVHPQEWKRRTRGGGGGGGASAGDGCG